jgi:opacity protein-like surface antigen
MGTRQRARLLGIAIAACLNPAGALAETALQIYGGSANSRDTAVSIDIRHVVPEVHEQVQVSDRYPTVGARFITWLQPRSWLGVGGDISHFHLDSPEVSIELVPVCAVLLVRYESAVFEPYGGVGLCAANYEIDVPPRSGMVDGVSERSIANGWDFHAGFAHAFSGHFTGFVEYRYTRFDIDYERSVVPIVPSNIAISEHITARPETDHLLVGLAYEF